MTKTIVIGLDAATWDIIDKMIGSGKIPNIESLLNTGVRGTVRSTSPPMTPPAWTSMATGVSPSDHGVYGFLSQNRQNYEITYESTELSLPAVWDVVNHEGENVGVVNFPSVYPPPEVEGGFISGAPIPDSAEIAHPPQLQAWMDEVGYFRNPDTIPEEAPEAYFREIKQITELQTDLTLRILEEYEPRLLWTVFMAVDWAQHFLQDAQLDWEPAVERVYELMDDTIGSLTSEIGDDDSIVLLSDHGARRTRGEIHLNSLLSEWGYLNKESERQNDTSVKSKLKQLGWSAITGLSSSIKMPIKSRLSTQTLRTLQTFFDQGYQSLGGQIHWPTTTAFSYGSMGKIYINRKDEYSEGTVAPDEYESVRAEIVDKLRSATHPETDEQLFGTVQVCEDVYGSDPASHPPDILAEPADWAYSVFGDFGDQWIHGPRDRQGDHHPEGIVVASGQGVDQGQVAIDAVDVAPTLLALSGMPTVAEMEGSVCQEMIAGDTDTGVVSTDSITTTSGENDPRLNDEEVEKRLENLGYK